DKTISEKMVLLSRFIQEMEQMKFARSYQQNTLLKQEINQLKKKQKVWIQEYSEQLTQAGLSYPSEVPVFLQKAKQAEQQMKRYNIWKTAKTERKAIPTTARRKRSK